MKKTAFSWCIVSNFKATQSIPIGEENRNSANDENTYVVWTFFFKYNCISACVCVSLFFEQVRQGNRILLVAFKQSDCHFYCRYVCDCVCALFEDVNFIPCHIFPIAVWTMVTFVRRFIWYFRYIWLRCLFADIYQTIKLESLTYSQNVCVSRWRLLAKLFVNKINWTLNHRAISHLFISVPLGCSNKIKNDREPLIFQLLPVDRHSYPDIFLMLNVCVIILMAPSKNSSQ